ncbi:MAG: ABC transporter substrate-binding protein, partial [Novosphingobium sp.]
MLALGSCAPAPHGQGAHLHPAIVSLNPCTDAILAEVADPAQLLAISAYSRDPASSSMDLALARRLPSTNGTVEEVMALRPDVVVSGTYTAPATRAAFAGLGLRLEELPIAATVAESESQVRQLAMLAGHADRGEALIARIESALAAARPASGAEPLSAVVWESGGIVAGDGTLIADLLRRTGFANMAAARGMGQAQVLPLERMLADPPRVILAAGNSVAQENRILRHPALAALKGTARARLDPALLWCGGPTIVKAAARLAEIRGGIVTPKPLLFRGGVGVG